MKRFLKWFFRLALRISAIAAAAAFVAFIAERIGEIKAYGKELRHKPYGIYERFVKRPLDCFLSTGALIVFSPILLVLTILGAIKMGGNPFFTQERPGRNEKIFSLIKFRTMNNKRDENGNLLPDDVRLTKYGKALRATSLDELPELVNIVKGDMAVVGPRPLLVKYLDRYNDHQRRRHDVRPGLTGYAQAHGRNALTWEDKFDLDVKYVDHVSFTTDVSVIKETVLTVLRHDGISQTGEATMVEFLGSKEVNV